MNLNTCHKINKKNRNKYFHQQQNIAFFACYVFICFNERLAKKNCLFYLKFMVHGTDK